MKLHDLHRLAPPERPSSPDYGLPPVRRQLSAAPPLWVELTARGPQLVERRHASTFPTHDAALIASAGQRADIVRVDA